MSITTSKAIRGHTPENEGEEQIEDILSADVVGLRRSRVSNNSINGIKQCKSEDKAVKVGLETSVLNNDNSSDPSIPNTSNSNKNDMISKLSDEMSQLTQDVKQILMVKKGENQKKNLDCQLEEYFADLLAANEKHHERLLENHREDANAFEKTYDNIITKIISSQEEISVICQGIKQLQLSTSNAHVQGEAVSKNIEQLLRNVDRSQQDVETLTNNLKVMTEELRKNKLEEKEALMSLKVRKTG